MRRLLMLLVGFLASVFMFAESVDKTQALRKAQKFMPGKIFKEVKSVSKARGDASGDAFYVFNAEKNDGFVIVSGDDRTVPILGYSRTGSIDMDKIPENMKWWLDSYARQMEAICIGSLLPSAKLTTTSPKAAIPAMIQTRWGQGAPYNLMCPDENFLESGEKGYDPTKRCLTGCVATAMAQVMYYHGWPESCPAIDQYSVGEYDISGNYTEKGKIKAIPSTTFDWTKIKTSYNAEETGEAAQEVAKLMRYCGQAMNVEYGVDGTGGYLSPSLLASVFNYSKNIRELSRDSYTTRQWEAFIYDELVAGRPVLYGGSTKKYAGHQFIVDGYDGSGLFHINWGWGGFKDSYFVLSIADPDNPGAGADSSEGAYQIGQSALIGVKPAEVGEVMLPSVTCYVNPDAVSIATYTRDDASMDFKDVVLTGQVFASYMMEPPSDMTIEYGWALYQDDNLIKAFDNNNGTVLTTQWWWNSFNNDKTISFGAGLTDGKYQLSQIYRLSGDTEWKRCGDYGANSCIAEVSAKSLNVRLADTGNSSFVVNNMSLATELPEIYSPVELKLNVTNNGESRRLLLNLWAKKEGTENWVSLKSVLLYINPGETEDVLISYIPENAGTYTLKVTDNTSDEALKTATVSVVSNETIIIDNVKYLCTPAYNLAKVIGYDGEPEMLTSINIRQTVEAGGVECQVKEISDWALVSLWNVKSLVIPQGVERIGESAFRWMSNLTKLELPASLKSIGEYVTQDCPQLNAVISRINEPGQVAVNARAFSTVQWNNGVESLIPSPATLYVPVGTKSKYEAISAWKQFAGIEEGEVAESVVNGLRYFYSTGGTTATVIQDDSYQSLTEVTIPATVGIGSKTYDVTAIGNEAFFDCRNLATVVLPEGLIAIGNNAFNNISVSEIILPSTLKTISAGAFQNCWNVTTLVVPNGVETIGDYAFSYMYGLTRLELPASLKRVGKYVIRFDTQLTSVISRISDPSQVSVEDNSFFSEQYNESTEQWEIGPSQATLYVPVGTKSNYEAIAAWTQFAGIEEGEIAESVVGVLRYSYSTGGTTATVIKDDSYQSLTDVTIPATINVGSKTYYVTAIGGSAFQSCESLASVKLSEGLMTIGDNAFQNISVSEITFPNTLKKIGAHAFEDCNNITTIVIPEGVETIGEYAFSYIWKLSKLELPASLKSIGRYVITYDSQLETVVSRINNPSQVTIDENAFSQNLWNGSTWEIKPSSATLYVPVGTKPNYEAITAWTQFANIVEGELMETTDGVLRYSYLAGGNTATVIYDDSYMTLTNVVIPATITVKGTDYFVTAIGNNAFYECKNLQSVTISDGITVIGNRAFEGVHDGDTEFTLPSTLTTIGENAFWNVNGLKTLILPDGLESIGNSAFAYCNGLTEVELPAALTSIGQRVFVGDGSLSSVRSKIESPMAIDESAFAVSSEWDESNNTYINEPTSAVLYVPEGKKGVYESTPGWDMFSAIEEGTPFIYSDGILKYSCSPSSMTATLIIDAIYQELTNVEIPATITVNGVEYHVKTIGNAAFQDCRNLQSVVLHEGLETIGNFAFQSSSVSEINLPSTLKKIGESAFQNCWNVETIVVPDGVENIGNQAFSSMGSLTRIELPASLKSLGSSVILNNQMLTEVICHITDPFVIDSSVFGIYHWNDETGSFYTPSPYTLYVPASTKDKYQAIPGWTMFAGIEEGEPFDYIIDYTLLKLRFRCSPDSKTAILIHDDSYSGITQVNISATIDVNGDVYRVKAIGARAFADCWQLTKVILPEGVVSIGTNAFSWTALSSINFPSTLKTIRNNAFWDCEGLTSVELPEGLETIESYAFAECSNLENLVIPSTVTSIGWGVIMYDESLATVTSRIINPYAVEDGAFVIGDQWDQENQVSIFTLPTATLYVPGGKRDVYQKLNGWNVFQNMEEYVLSGDANGDGDVDNQDLDIVVRYIMGEKIENFIFKNADTNEDDKVDVGDVVKLIDKLKLAVN